ncbi:hypothetical protein P7C73_g3540, partial [Tremellales sp. Uapishka_1]
MKFSRPASIDRPPSRPHSQQSLQPAIEHIAHRKGNLASRFSRVFSLPQKKHRVPSIRYTTTSTSERENKSRPISSAGLYNNDENAASGILVGRASVDVLGRTNFGSYSGEHGPVVDVRRQTPLKRELSSQPPSLTYQTSQPLYTLQASPFSEPSSSNGSPSQTSIRPPSQNQSTQARKVSLGPSLPPVPPKSPRHESPRRRLFTAKSLDSFSSLISLPSPALVIDDCTVQSTPESDISTSIADSPALFPTRNPVLQPPPTSTTMRTIPSYAMFHKESLDNLFRNSPPATPVKPLSAGQPSSSDASFQSSKAESWLGSLEVTTESDVSQPSYRYGAEGKGKCGVRRKPVPEHSFLESTPQSVMSKITVESSNYGEAISRGQAGLVPYDISVDSPLATVHEKRSSLKMYRSSRPPNPKRYSQSPTPPLQCETPPISTPSSGRPNETFQHELDDLFNEVMDAWNIAPLPRSTSLSSIPDDCKTDDDHAQAQVLTARVVSAIRIASTPALQPQLIDLSYRNVHDRTPSSEVNRVSADLGSSERPSFSVVIPSPVSTPSSIAATSPVATSSASRPPAPQKRPVLGNSRTQSTSSSSSASGMLSPTTSKLPPRKSWNVPKQPFVPSGRSFEAVRAPQGPRKMIGPGSAIQVMTKLGVPRATGGRIQNAIELFENSSLASSTNSTPAKRISNLANDITPPMRSLGDILGKPPTVSSAELTAESRRLMAEARMKRAGKV